MNSLYVNLARQCIKDWKRFLLLCVVSAIPLVNIVSLGYMMRVFKARYDKPEDHSLPSWDFWWSMIVPSLRLVLVTAVWAVPLGLFLLSGSWIVNTVAVGLALSAIIWFVGIATFYFIPAIFALESANVWGSFHANVLRMPFSLSYLKHWVIIMVLNILLYLTLSWFGWFIPLYTAYITLAIAEAFSPLRINFAYKK